MSNFRKPYYLEDDPFEKLFNFASTDTKGSNYPPYNLYYTDSEWFIEAALAGFAKDEIEVFIEPKVRRSDKRSLVVRGNAKQKTPDDKIKYKVRGIAMRNFKLPFTIDDDAEIKEAKFEDGLLRIVVSSVVKTSETDPIPIPIL